MASSLVGIPVTTAESSRTNPAPGPSATAADEDADGISAPARTRLHRGNIPSIPQTKSCPLCPAKFTRTTHLSRHLRTHTREKLHECERCQSQFTRSDLLTRHKRTCGDQHSANRSRRKSCLACASSKVKCDLQQPCGRCQARGRDCIYVRAAPPTPTSESAAASTSKDSMDPVNFDELCGPIPSSISVPMSLPDFGSAMPRGLPDFMGGPAMHAGPVSFPGSPFSLGAPSTVNFSIESSSTFALIDQGLSTVAEPQTEDSVHDDFNSFMNDIFSPSQPMMFSATSSPANSQGIAPLDVNGTADWSPSLLPFISTASGTGDESLQHTVLDPVSAAGTGTSLQTEEAGSSLSAPTPQRGPSAADLKSYLTLFFSAYLPNMPIVHEATFKAEDMSPLLITAMQACGALYVKTRVALDFIDSTLASARDTIFSEFTKLPKYEAFEERVYLMQAMMLLQTLGLFHQSAEQRNYSNIYHGLVAMSLHLWKFAYRTTVWVPPDDIDTQSVGCAWKQWILNESMKRVMSVSYIHDCCHCIYFTLRPTYSTAEFDICLPCEDSLWTASTADEWLSILKQSSPYGSTAERLRGARLSHTYSRLAVPVDQIMSQPLVLNPFAQFLVIYRILRQFFEEYIEARAPEVDRSAPRVSSPSSFATPEYISEDRIVAFQGILSRWLQGWRRSPDSPTYSETEPRFVHQALPFFWMAQVALVAYKERLPPFCPGTMFVVSNDAKFRLMKRWERHVRNYLRKGEKEPTPSTDEMIKFKLHIWKGAAQEVDNEDAVNLLGFFPRLDGFC